MEELSSMHYTVGGIVLVLIFLIFRKLRSGGHDSKLHYTTKSEPNAQNLYDEKYKNPNPLTKDEKIELSWQFLYDITDIVLNKFSKEDKDLIHEMGHKLVKNGGGYEHVVEYGLKREAKKSRLVEEQDKDKEKDTVAERKI